MRTAIIAVCAGLLPLGAYAHHGWSSYDASKPVTITGKLDDVRWENPHAMAYVTHGGKKAEIYLAPISRMVSRGLEKEALAIGKTVTLEAYASTANGSEFRAERITVDGKTIELR
jgi:hypothetical protein